MIDLVVNWFKNYFADPEVAILWLFLIFVVAVLAFFGNMLAPVLVSIAIAYLLQRFIVYLERWHIPHMLAVIITYLAFVSLVVTGLLVLMPILWHQLSNMMNELPNMLGRGQALLANLPERYPEYISAAQIDQIVADFRNNLSRIGQVVLSASFASIPSIMEVIVYLVLVPLLVYFFLMDRNRIIQWLKHYMPARRRLITQVWREFYAQIGNYVRGKVLEMIIVWVICYITFLFMGLQYAMLLSVLVGLSVIVPYVGAVVVTVPVLVIAFLQWNWTSHFLYLVIAYGIIVALDANVLVPLLFSEAVDLHPVAIIIAILVFGGLLGFWGVFFAIPLATLVKAILNAISKTKPKPKAIKH